MPYKGVPQGFPTRVTHKSALQECPLDICSFSKVFPFGFVGSILFFLKWTRWLFGSSLGLCLTGCPLSGRSEEVHRDVVGAFCVGVVIVMSLLLVTLWACGLPVSVIESCGKV